MRKLCLVLVLALAGFVPSAEAAFLSGSTAYTLIDANVLPTSDAPFDESSTITSTGVVVGISNTGDFTDGTVFSGTGSDPAGTAADFTYDPVIVPISPFITFTGLNGTNSFHITNFTVSFLDENAILVITGDGYWTGTGYDVTLGNFTLSGTRILGTDGNFSYQVGGTLNALGEPFDTPVPEPASMMLLGSGLVGVASAVRRRRNQKK